MRPSTRFDYQNCKPLSALWQPELWVTAAVRGKRVGIIDFFLLSLPHLTYFQDGTPMDTYTYRSGDAFTLTVPQ